MLRRILLIPHVGLVNVQSDSSFQEVYDFARITHELGEPAHFYMLLPHWAKNVPPMPPNTTLVTAEFTQDYWLYEVCGPPGDWLARKFTRRGGEFIVDAVYSGLVRSVLYMSQVLSDWRRVAQVPIFMADPVDTFWWMHKNWDHIVGNMANYLVAYPAMPRPDDVSIVLKYIKRWLAPWVWRAIESVGGERPIVSPIGFDMTVIDEVVQTNKKYDKMSLFCGMRFNQEKNVAFVLKVFRTLFSYGRDINICTTTGTEEVRANRFIPDKDLSMFKTLKYACPRSEYFAEAAKCHVFLSASKDETFGTHVLEQLLLGLVGVVPNEPWVWYTIPKEYPFVYTPRNRDEAYTMVAWVMDNYEQAQEMIRPIVEELRVRFCWKTAAKAFLGEIDRVVGGLVTYQMVSADEPIHGRKGASIKMKVVVVFAANKLAPNVGDMFSMDDLLEVIAPLLPKLDVKVLKQLGGSRLGVPTLYDLREILECNGFEDLCDGPYPRFIRRENAMSVTWDGTVEGISDIEIEEDREDPVVAAISNEAVARYPEVFRREDEAPSE